MRIRVSTNITAQWGNAYSSSSSRRGIVFLFDIGGVRHTCISLPSRFLGVSFNVHILISHWIRSVLDTWDVVMNNIEMLEVIVLILKIVLIRSVEGLGFVIVR